MHEWPLLIFSLLIQTAIGGTIALTIYLIFMKKNAVEAFQAIKMPLVVLSVISLIGLGASFLHLGKISHAFYTISSLGSSWFSREILFVSLFIFLLVLTLVLSMMTKKVNMLLLSLAAVVGFATLFVMSSIYATTMIEAWNGVGTYAAFYAAALVIGASIALALLNKQTSVSRMSLFVVAVIGLAIKLVVLPVHFGSLTEALSSTENSLLYSQLVLGVLGVIILGYVVFVRKTYHMALVWSAFLLVFIGEFLGRYLFFMNAI